MDKYQQRILEAAERLVSCRKGISHPDWHHAFGELTEAVRERNIAEARKAGM